MPRQAEYPHAKHFVLHLSDTHLLPGGAPLYGHINNAGYLRQLLASLEAAGTKPEAIIVTGDLTDKGEPQAYAALREIVDPVAERLGTRVIWVMGNHDDRANFRTELLADGPSVQPIDQVFDVNGLRVITLDSTVPGFHYGEVSDQQLEWLAAELGTPAPHGTILAMHHAPLPCILDLAVLVELRDQEKLKRVITGSDVRTILAGHLHFSTHGTFAGIPVSVAAATCYTQDLVVAVGGMRRQDAAQAYNLVHVYGDTVVHSVVPMVQHQTFGAVDAEEVGDRLREADVVIAPPGSPTTSNFVF
nr:phosphodiesterase [Nakamurella antarctica]